MTQINDNQHLTAQNMMPVLLELLDEQKKYEKDDKGRQKRVVMRKHNPTSRSYRILAKVNYINYGKFLYIDQKALKGQESSNQPFLESVFNFNRGASVEMTKQFIKINLEDRELPSSSIHYIIDRFRSYGDFGFYQLSNALQRLDKIMKDVSKIMLDFPQYYSIQAFSKVLDRYKGKAYMAGYSNFDNGELTMRSIVFSRKFAQIMGYDLEQFAIKFSRGILIKNFEVLNTAAYPNFIFNYVNLMHQFGERVLQNGFDAQIWDSIVDGEKFLTSDLHSPKKAKLRVQYKLNLHNPCFRVYEIYKIFAPQQNQYFKRPAQLINKQFSHLQFNRKQSDQTYDDQKAMVQQEIKTVEKICKVRDSQKIKNIKKICEYRIIPNSEERQKGNQNFGNQRTFYQDL